MIYLPPELVFKLSSSKVTNSTAVKHPENFVISPVFMRLTTKVERFLSDI